MRIDSKKEGLRPPLGAIPSRGTPRDADARRAAYSLADCRESGGLPLVLILSISIVLS